MLACSMMLSMAVSAILRLTTILDMHLGNAADVFQSQKKQILKRQNHLNQQELFIDAGKQFIVLQGLVPDFVRTLSDRRKARAPWGDTKPTPSAWPATWQVSIDNEARQSSTWGPFLVLTSLFRIFSSANGDGASVIK